MVIVRIVFRGTLYLICRWNHALFHLTVVQILIQIWRFTVGRSCTSVKIVCFFDKSIIFVYKLVFKDKFSKKSLNRIYPSFARAVVLYLILFHNWCHALNTVSTVVILMLSCLHLAYNKLPWYQNCCHQNSFHFVLHCNWEWSNCITRNLLSVFTLFFASQKIEINRMQFIRVISKVLFIANCNERKCQPEEIFDNPSWNFKLTVCLSFSL